MATLSTPDSKTDYLNHLSDSICVMRQELDFTDVDLEIDDQLIPAHRLILCGASRYFRAMFKSGMNEAIARKVKISGVDLDTMDVVLNYIYTGDLHVEDNTISLLSVLSTAHIFQLCSLYDQCFQLLMHERRLKACFADLWHLTELYNEIKGSEQISEYVKCNFRNLTSSSQFPMLTFMQLKSLVESPLNCSADDIVNTILVWVSHDSAERQANLMQLLTAVHLESLTSSYISKLQEHELIRERNDVLHLLLKSAIGVVPGLHCNPKHSVFCFGNGTNRKSFIATYMMAEKKWETKEIPILITVGTSVAFHDEYLYFIGGGDKVEECTNTVYQYCLKTNSTVSVEPLRVPKLFSGSAAFRNKLFVVGGLIASGALRDAEVYDEASNMWQAVAPTNKTHVGPQVTVAADHLYVVGSLMSSIVEQYNPSADQWTLMKSVPFFNLLFPPQVTVLFNKLHILQEKDIVYVYNPLRNEWETDICNQELAMSSNNDQHEFPMHSMFMYLVENNSVCQFNLVKKHCEQLCTFPENVCWNMWQTIIICN